MKKLSVILFFLVAVVTVQAQVHDPRALPKINSFMVPYKAIAVDSALQIPRYFSNYNPTNDTTPRIFVVGDELRWFSRGNYYSAAGGGSSFDSTSLSRRINLKLNWSDTTLMLAPYLTKAAAALTYYPLTNPAGYISNVTGLILPGANVSITGTGVSGNPYVINASGGGGGSHLDTLFISVTSHAHTPFGDSLLIVKDTNHILNRLMVNGSGLTEGINADSSFHYDLGGTITHNTVVDVANFNLNFIHNDSVAISAKGVVTIGDINPTITDAVNITVDNPGLFIGMDSRATGTSIMGDINFVGSGTVVAANDANKQIFLNANNGLWMIFGGTNNYLRAQASQSTNDTFYLPATGNTIDTLATLNDVRTGSGSSLSNALTTGHIFFGVGGVATDRPTTDITALGTVVTGTWHGTAIGDTWISSAATWNAKQAALSGTGFVKISGTTISYDNSTYLTTAAAASTYFAIPTGTTSQYIRGDGTLATYTAGISTFTTTGTSGVATYSAGTLNIPNYTYTLPTATTSVLGGVKIDGTSITISGGVISAVAAGAQSLTTTGSSGAATLTGTVLNIPNYTYTLPTATTSVLGGVKIDGTSITIASGVISAAGATSIGTFNTTSTANGLDITSGVLKLHAADATNPGALTAVAQSIAGKKTFSVDAVVNTQTVGLGGSAVATNTVLGYQALFSNTTGFYSIAEGYQALFNNTTGNQNVAIGVDALYGNVSGTKNIGIGTSAGQNNVSGSNNIHIGYLSGNNNTASSFLLGIGYQTLQNNSTGTNNIAIGDQSMHLHTSGSWNTAVGILSLATDTSGQKNTAMGYGALSGTYNTSFNTAVGYLAGDLLIDGDNCTLIGYNSAQASTHGEQITLLGAHIGGASTSDTLIEVVGFDNFGFNNSAIRTRTVAIGDSIGSLNSKYTNDIFIGRKITGNGGVTTLDNTTLIGHNLATNRNNFADFGTATQVIQLGNGGQTNTAINALTGVESDIVYNNTNHNYQFYNGTAWLPITSGQSNVTTQSGGTYTITATDVTVVFTGSTTTATFPTAVTGKILHLVNHGTGSVTLGTAVTTANGVTSTTLTAGSNYEIQYDGTVWRKFN